MTVKGAYSFNPIFPFGYDNESLYLATLITSLLSLVGSLFVIYLYRTQPRLKTYTFKLIALL